MTRPFWSRRSLALVAGLWLISGYGHAADAGDPWAALSELRDSLAAQTRQANFLQTFQPAGFATGDRETGHLFLSLPSCVRWEYEEPFPKSFLLCENLIYSWNPGEQAGRRYSLAESEEPGIDLLRLQPEVLRQRYEARLETPPEGGLEVVLTPRLEGVSIQEARIGMDDQRQFLTNLSYRDLEGNLSRFEITEYKPLEDVTFFEPPADLDWLDQ